MDIKQYIKKKLVNTSLIIKDNHSYLYLVSEQFKDIQKYNLGDGAFVSAISLFALLNYISKIYAILVKGSQVITTEKDVDEYNLLKEQIKEIDALEWRKIKKYFRKPRIGDVNETDAFILFIENCPIDFGINKKNRKEIQRIWTLYRNKLTHIISLAGDHTTGQMLINLRVQPSQEGMYPINLDFIKKRLAVYKPFDITKDETKKAFMSNNEIDNETLQYILKDKCHVDRLMVVSQMAIDWLVNELDTDKFDIENCMTLVNWLENELKSSE